jgi:hypothetical protein
MPYFGHNSTGTSSQAVNVSTMGNTAADSGVTIQCPGTGIQDVKSLEGYCRSAATGRNCRLAIYPTGGGNLVMQGNAEIDVASILGTSTPGWVGHTTFRDYNGNVITSPQLTGGSNYVLVFSTDASVSLYYTSTTNACATYYGYDYTGGFANALPNGAGPYNFANSLRCLVESQSSSNPIPGRIIQWSNMNGMNGGLS